MKHFTPKPQLVLSVSHFEENGLHLLVHPSQPQWLVLNNLGYEVACLCNGRHSLAQMATRLAYIYKLNTSLLRQHVAQYTRSLAEKGWFSSPLPLKSEPSSRLKSLVIQITERCNLRCQHCHVWDSSRPPSELSLRQIKALVDQVVEQGGRALTLSGGEPLLHPQFKDILRYAGSKLRVQVLSNGTLIDSSTATLLAELGVKLQVSLDGATQKAHDRIRGYGAFAKSLKGLKLLQKAGVEVVICAVIMQGNVKYQEEMLQLAQSCGSALRFIPLRCSGRAKSNWDGLQPSLREYSLFYRQHLLAESKKFTVICNPAGLVLNLPSYQPRWCPIGRNIIINAQGEAYPCTLMMSRKYYLGDIKQLTLSQIISSDKLIQICRIRNTRPLLIPKCAACPWKNLCQAGCMGLAQNQRKSLWETDDFCSLRQELYPQLIFSLAQKKLPPNKTQYIELGGAA